MTFKKSFDSYEFYGSIEVQLTDAFFNDPLAIELA